MVPDQHLHVLEVATQLLFRIPRVRPLGTDPLPLTDAVHDEVRRREQVRADARVGIRLAGALGGTTLARFFAMNVHLPAEVAAQLRSLPVGGVMLLPGSLQGVCRES